jgi:hypothetical protein
MRTSTTHHSSVKSPKPPSAVTEGDKKKPDWMVRLQQKKKEEFEEIKDNNRHEVLFPNFSDTKSEITYIEDEDDIAQSYFRCAGNNGASASTLDSGLTDDTVSGYNFDDLILDTEVTDGTVSGYNFDDLIE